MGRASVVHAPQDIPGSSREVFQGLFKDLGMQAMALEAILRAVCGRVDKLETWLTEVSFGMTELDLKLRNIAHNIDGTAAVDDEAQGPLRWAIPTSEDVHPKAATVSKKLGSDKKAVRVTGMAAAILDRLATTGTSTPAVVEDEKVERSGVKKKNKDKKHGTKKVKTNVVPDVPETPPPAKVEMAPPPAIPLPVPIPESKQVKAEPEVSAIEQTENKPSASVKNVSTEAIKRDVPVKAPVVSSLFPTIQVERTIEPFVLKGTAHTTPVESSPPKVDPVPTPSVPDLEPAQPVPLIGPHTPAVPAAEVETSEILPLDNDSDIVPSLNENASIEEQKLTRPTTPPPTTPQPDTTQIDPQRIAENQNSVPVLSTPSTAKVSLVQSPISKPSANEPIGSEGELKSTLINHSPPPTEEPKVIPARESTMAVEKTIKPAENPTHAPQPSQETKPLLSPATEPAVDPLLRHRASTHRRSSKMAPRPSFSKKIERVSDNEAARQASGTMRGYHSRPTSIALPAPVVEHEPQEEPSQQPEPQPAPTLQPIAPPTMPPPMNTTMPDDIDEESSESSEGSSESSVDSSESSDSSADEEQDEDDEETGAAVEEISKTMLALKKLKKAHMLSPEEEVKLKERAHKKWFQLKGHIKEKQKKDVTNILLKRKKNVFTVSSRIELLEEKSREIFAALKQIATDMRDKSDRSAHETLRRRVFDIEQSLLNIDSRFASLSAPASEKVSELESEIDSLRVAIQMQLTTAQSEATDATARHLLLEEALASQRGAVEALELVLAQDIPAQLNVQADLFSEKLKQLPDYHAAIENLKRSLRRKADLKLLKELEARWLGLDAESEDCLVRCLSCHKEVTQPYNEVDTQEDESGNGSQLRKVNPGPSSARIYRSNVPFNAQVIHDSILEESPDVSLFSRQSLMHLPVQDGQSFQHQSAGDSLASEKPPGIRVPSVRWSNPPVEINLKKVLKPPQAAPLSLMNVTATRAVLSPDRPISAPVAAMKRKSSGSTKAKALLKSLTPQLE